MGELIDLNPKSANSIDTIPDDIARDAEYIAADAAHVAALHPSRVFGFGEGISTENVFDYGSGFLDCRGGGGAFPPGTNHIQGFQARFNYMGSRWGMQLATQHHLNADCFFRTVSNDIWGPWRKIWNDGNFNPSNYLLISEGDNRYRQSAVALVDADIPAAIARDSEVTAALNAHTAAVDPHPIYLSQAEGDSRYRQFTVALTDADIPAAIARDVEVTAALNAHTAAVDPHPVYLSQAEGDARYSQSQIAETAWTPTIYGGTVAGTVNTYYAQQAISATIGNIVFIQGTMTWTGATGSGDMRIGGLPVTSRFGMGNGTVAIWVSGLILPTGNFLQGSQIVRSGFTSYISIQQANSAGNANSVQLTNATIGISFSGFYFK